MWICRAGQKSIYKDYFLTESKIFLTWGGYKIDLRGYDSRLKLKNLVIQEKGNQSRTSVSNWAGQLYSFCYEMSLGDYVLIPHEGSRKYTLAQITGDYEYNPIDLQNLFHSREITIILDEIPREIFPQKIQYSLGAFRTIFKSKHENEILKIINEWKK